MGYPTTLEDVSDGDLLRRLRELVGQSRRVEADLVAHIGEVDQRRLYAREATPSMFAYCTEVLHLSEAESWLRILVARSAREHPVLLTMLRDGRLHLSGIRRLAPHLTRDNRERLLKRAVHKTRREIEELVAEIAPRPDAPSVMRKLPERRGEAPPAATPGTGPGPGSDPIVPGNGRTGAGQPATGDVAATNLATSDPAAPHQTAPHQVAPADDMRVVADASASDPQAASPPQPGPDPVARAAGERSAARVEPLSPGRYKVQFTASEELRDKLERLQALMRTSVPDGDLAAVIDMAVTREIERLEARRFAKTKAPRANLGPTDAPPTSRHVPAAVKRAVEKRDGGRCAYRDKRGRRCSQRHGLEFQHRVPFSHGRHHSPENLALVCRTHNTLMAEHDYGKEVMARHRRAASPSPAQEILAPTGNQHGSPRHAPG
jgi:hypothetical protein